MTTIELVGAKSVVQVDLESLPTGPTFEWMGEKFKPTSDPLVWEKIDESSERKKDATDD